MRTSNDGINIKVKYCKQKAYYITYYKKNYTLSCFSKWSQKLPKCVKYTI